MTTPVLPLPQLFAALLLTLGVALPAPAQQGPRSVLGPPAIAGITVTVESGARRDSVSASRFNSRADSLSWVRTRDASLRASGRRLIVSIHERRLWWMNGADTIYSAPVAVGTGLRLESREGTWEFSTPRGVRRVLAKEKNPVWTPPDWHYVELAQDSAFGLVRLQRGRGVPLNDGSRVVVRGERIGRILPDGRYEELPADEEIIVGRTIFIPPLGTANRRIAGELGAYKLDMGDSYLLHGTPHKDSIGTAATHGCIRLHDEDLEYIYRNIPVGTAVYIY
ncbi:hypothetical protein BH23GEM7_BH23GEM7_33670 [soil metagenome]